MDSDLWKRVRATFEEAVDRPPAEQQAILDQRFGTDDIARQECGKMLAAEREATDNLEPPTPATLMLSGATLSPLGAERAGTRVGRYRILRLVGSGGVGSVYEAEQDNPSRRVALKMSRLPLASAEAQHRFHYESQVLARLEHPNIARIFEAGLIEEGSLAIPWFALELVRDASTITAYAAAEQLSIEARVSLFLQACEAVHHGHQRGIIHRDLKPGNILVNAEGEVRVIDFGIARGIDSANTRQLTGTGQLLGTLQYMSPEQLSGDPRDIDTRSDVYALGLVLYELLANRGPHDLEGKSIAEVGQILTQVDPPRPSRYAKGLPSEVDWITLQAVAVNREERYGSVEELAADLRRMAAHEPIHAGAPGTGYYLRKFVRRNRVAVTAAALVFLSLLAGVIATALQKARADRQATEAQEQRLLAQQKVDEFDRLANVVHLDAAIEAEKELYPAWPEQIPAMVDWLERWAMPLRGAVAEIEATLASLRKQALPATEDDLRRWRQRHPLFAKLATTKASLRSLRQEAANRRDPAGFQPVDLGNRFDDLDVAHLLYHAWQRTSPGRDSFGNEAEGLAIARLAVTKANQTQRPEALETLAWALVMNGLDDEGLRVLDQALELAGPGQMTRLPAIARDIRNWVAQAKDGVRSELIKTKEHLLKGHELELANHREWHFAKPSDQFLHDTLVDLIERVHRFERVQVTNVLDRLSTAAAAAKSIEANAGLWARAKTAIREADGITASARYADHPIDLVPQPGLAPIGMNPVTKLWEFYALRPPYEHGATPRHDQEGNARSDTIVFALLPGGAFTMGSQRHDQGGANYDRYAQDIAFPPHEVLLDPFLVARHEICQDQWHRWTGKRPSYFGNRKNPGRLPVENVDWNQAHDTLNAHGMVLPTEAQWEYAARAGLDTPWPTGHTTDGLEAYARINLPADRAYRPADIDSLRPNAFGLHHTLGNVMEWCRDNMFRYVALPRPGDGQRNREPVPSLHFVMRGGAGTNPFHSSTYSYRASNLAHTTNPWVGVRAARSLCTQPHQTKLELDAGFARRVARTVPPIEVLEYSGAAPAMKPVDPSFRPLTLCANVSDFDGVAIAHGGQVNGYALYVLDGIPRFGVRVEGTLHEVHGPKLTPGRHFLTAILDADGVLKLRIDDGPADQVQGQLLRACPKERCEIGADRKSVVGSYSGGLGHEGRIHSARLWYGVVADEQCSRWMAQE